MIYLHIPFCKSFCIYCGFYSEICKSGTTAFKTFEKSVLKEITLREKDIIETLPVNTGSSKKNTFYIGGGTPSVLPFHILKSIFNSINKVVTDFYSTDKQYDEFTIEVNPEDIVQKGEKYVEELIGLGVNRVSMGVQSFDDSILKWMNRRHSADTAISAYEILKKSGIKNISIDLIFGFSGLTEKIWQKTIDTAISLNPEHISAYQLSIDENSALDSMISQGKYQETVEEDCRMQYDILCQTLAGKGYGHYEISNFAKPGFVAIHNSAYWERVPYVGLGPGAHSFTGTKRLWNTKSISLYDLEYETLSQEEVSIERIMLNLRTDKGCDQSFLLSYCDNKMLNKLLKDGFLVKTLHDKIRIPEKHFFISDDIIKQLI